MQVRILGQRNGHVGQRARGDEPQLARHPLCRGEQRIPCGCLLRGRVGQGQLHVSEAVFTVERACHMRLAHERPLRAGVDGVVRPQQMHHAPRVRERVAQQAVARHGGQADDLQLRQRVRQHDGDGIVRAGVAVDPDGNLFRCHAFASP